MAWHSIRLRSLAASLLLGLAVPGLAAQTRPAQSQTRPPRPFVEHGFVTFNAGAQLTAGDLSDHVPFEANAETGSIRTMYPGRPALVFDGGAGFLVRRHIGIAVNVSRATRSGAAAVTAEIPHPFFDDRHRVVEGDARDISHNETAVHAQVYYELQQRGPWRIRLLAGPSYFNVEQELVTEVSAIETFPFDTAEFGRATTTRVKGSAVGFTGAIDVSRMLGRRVAVGGLVRYAGASVDLDAPGSREVSIAAGGFQALAGLRVAF